MGNGRLKEAENEGLEGLRYVIRCSMGQRQISRHYKDSLNLSLVAPALRKLQRRREIFSHQDSSSVGWEASTPGNVGVAVEHTLLRRLNSKAED